MSCTLVTFGMTNLPVCSKLSGIEGLHQFHFITWLGLEGESEIRPPGQALVN